MKALTKTRLFLALIFAGITAPVAIYFYILFSHDVSVLLNQYPHVKVLSKSDVEVTFSAKKPAYWASLGEISNFGRWAIVLSEDWSFYQHAGIDVEQLKVAIEEMWNESRFRGASTISQQMTKNIFLTEDRTLWRKLNEYILTQKIEKILKKDKILEIYLNSIEFGPKIYGIRAASKHYFQKNPSSLSPREGAFLAMLLPSPKRYYISFKRKRLTTFAKKRITAILEKMRMGKIISKERYQQEVDAPFPWETN